MTTSVGKLWERPTPAQLARVLSAITDPLAMQNFLRDVMTEKEIIEISARLEAANMLQAGRTYTEIVARTKLSSRTVARISDWLQNGQGGYREALALVDAYPGHIPPVRAA